MSEETKNKGTEKETETTTTCCKPEAMQDFFRNMAACCSGPGDTPDCKDRMKRMKEKFFGGKAEGTKTGCGEPGHRGAAALLLIPL